MYALCVTVSIPLLLVLAGFNHAHGLTTFGKSNNQGTLPQQPAVQPKACITQGNCTLIKGTTCLRGFCYCGDNTHPANGICKAAKKGSQHICNDSVDCVDDADCIVQPKNKTNPWAPEKICVCLEGLTETPGGACGGESNFMVLPGLMLVITALSRTLN